MSTIYRLNYNILRCNYIFWLVLDAQQDEIKFLVLNKLQKVFKNIFNPDIQKPFLVIVIGKIVKKVALEIFGIKRNRKSIVSQNASEIHFYIDFSNVFNTPLFIAETRVCKKKSRKNADNIYYEIIKQPIKRPKSFYNMQKPVNKLYTNLLVAFTDVFCLFCGNFGGFNQITIELVFWFDRNFPSSFSGRVRPRLIIIID